MVSERAWSYLFYCSLIFIPTLSLFGRELQSLASNNNLIGLAENIITAGLIATSLLIGAARTSGVIKWPIVCVAIIVFVLIPYQLDRYEERLHFICFGMLGFTAHRSLGFKMAAILTWSVSLGDETLQHFLPHRVGDWRDVIMNGFAGLSAVLLSHKVAK